ncbi:MAG: ATP-binding protein [Candidatus Dormibacteria bacterium]
MRRSLRSSIAAKLIAFGGVLAVVIVGGVAGYLIIGRAGQVRDAAQSNADNRVLVMRQVIDRFVAVDTEAAASSLVTQQSLEQALAAPDPATAVAQVFSGGTSVDLAGQVLLVTDGAGDVIYDHPSPTVATDFGFGTPLAVAAALRGGSECLVSDQAPTPGGCGVEILGNGQPAYVVALPVVSQGRTVGVVAAVAPLAYQLTRFQSLFGYVTAFIAAGDTSAEVRPTSGGSGATAPELSRQLGNGGADIYRAVYTAPVAGASPQAVAASFVPVRGPDGAITGYIGIEVPISQFAGDEGPYILGLSLISIFVLLLVVIAVVVFVERFVKRPIARLESGVARIAGGDYSGEIVVRSRDELGRLARNVNLMRDAIAGYVSQLQEARRRIDTAVERLSGVSRALTTTTTGVDGLQQAVVATAVSMAAGRAAAMLAVREGDRLVPVASHGKMPPLTSWTGVSSVLQGETVELEHPRHGRLVGVPMFYQDGVVGALLLSMPQVAEGQSSDVDVDVLAVLANNTAIAMENARLFEQERETVRRLLQLDSMKTDFLSTVQHELRTPLTAILGLSDLLDMTWERWDDEHKLDAIRDIQVAAKNLYDIVETIIDYSALEDDNLTITPTDIPVRPVLEQTLSLLDERYKGGLPVQFDVDGDMETTVWADPDRMPQVLRAILDNAAKFSGGRGRVQVSITPADADGMVRIEVRDQGIGIAEAEVGKIFDRFYQVDNTATRSYGGTGMGLALVKRMAELHGARVDVSSVLGEGTTVVLMWPARSPAASSGASATGGQGGPEPVPPRPARRRKPAPQAAGAPLQ